MLIASTAFIAMGQTVNTPYSKLGFGILNDTATGIQRSMGGVGYAMQNGRQINVMNPASYSRVDSLTFLLDMGMDVTNSWSKEDGKSGYNLGGGLDYITMEFRLAKNLGAAIGVIPYSSVGYSFGGSIENGSDSRTGSGGLSELFAAHLGAFYSIWLQCCTQEPNRSRCHFLSQESDARHCNGHYAGLGPRHQA